jgi:Ni/Fe-hydrogenase subunit HybB-like protein
MKHAPENTQPFFTPGMRLLTVLMLAGLGCGAFRLFAGLGAATNLNNQYPLGLWIGLDVATGVALAAGGFTSAALVYIFNREHFHAIIRPALLTALLGYTFVAIGLMFDLGRWYVIWHPMLPSMWQGNSVLFEVAVCVMLYLGILYLEFAPIVCERFTGRVRLPGIFSKMNNTVDLGLRIANHVLGRIMPALIIAGVVLSCLHQSSLGTLMVIAPYKLHPLYWSPFLPLFFLLSAVAVGFPMIITESLLSARALNRKPELKVLSALSQYCPWLIGIYIVCRTADMLLRGTWVFLFEPSSAAFLFWIEFGLLTVVPCCLFMSRDVRSSTRSLMIASGMYLLGIALNRCAVFFLAINPPYAQQSYVPALTEFGLTIGLVLCIIFCYRAAVHWLPVLPHAEDCIKINGRGEPSDHMRNTHKGG